VRVAVLTIGCVIGSLVLSVLMVPEGEVATLSTYAADGRDQSTQVWLVDGEELPGASPDAIFLRAHSRRAGWLARLQAAPQVELARQGEVRPYRAEVGDPDALREPLNRAMAAKYGVADRLLALLVDPAISVPVRLVPDPTRESASRVAPGEHARPQ
jgi:hypothetical protein